MTVLQTERLGIQLGQRVLLRGLDWQVSSGELWCVLGRNGVGKTSLLQTLAGLLPPSAGRVLIDQVDLARIAVQPLARLRGLMPQQQLDAFSNTLVDTVLIGRTPYRIGRGWDSSADVTAAHDALARVDLADRADSDVLQLSGGERQRLALATLLLQAPAIMLLDEPTAHQDVAHQLQMLRLIQSVSRQHAVVMNCHDISLAVRFATHVLVLGDGFAQAGEVASTLDSSLLAAAFGCRFTFTGVGRERVFVAR